MIAAKSPRISSSADRLLVLNESSLPHPITDSYVSDLHTHLRPHDLLIVNDSATLPASLRATLPSGATAEIRLVSSEKDGSYLALLFGDGNWKTKTEERAVAEIIPAGAILPITECLTARIEPRIGPMTSTALPSSRRLIRISFNHEKARLLTEIYRAAKPIQYSYMENEIPLWSVQNIYASRPWSVEMPSAGRVLSSAILLKLLRQGVTIASLTHAAGISSTGDATLDAHLPFKERYEIPEETVQAISRARRLGGRVIAVGTSVVRALESSALKNAGYENTKSVITASWHGDSSLADTSSSPPAETGYPPVTHADYLPVAGTDETDLIIKPGFNLRIVDGLLTGMHEPTESHFELLGAFVSKSLLERARHYAEERNYLTHEFGDSCLIIK